MHVVAWKDSQKSVLAEDCCMLKWSLKACRAQSQVNGLIKIWSSYKGGSKNAFQEIQQLEKKEKKTIPGWTGLDGLFRTRGLLWSGERAIHFSQSLAP